ncbi:sulfur oxidation c-type cytochrome SoxA [Albimonas pacifica]|uniref:SoxAX cytochrome complex subunit A n=1 Tax=Albimonas pacifica TaxID=1114924 RepID=A0A1I3H5L9_9RHOB|nr:sulfur oxidation c-type cytochrome SoxA [Albimonas pacifica]SFI31016.1 diheme cytochrome SoxA (sulfur oxidation) [Albimonas pacifica]
MKKTATALAALLALGLAGSAGADPSEDAELSINGEPPLITRAPAPAHLEGALPELISGWLYRDEATRAMEMDDFDNPAMVFVDQGLDSWAAVEGSAGKSCAACHGDIESLKGVRATTPKLNAAGALWSVEDFINDCRTNRMGAEAWGWSSDPMLNMTAAISVQSRGLPVAVEIDGPAAPYYEQGKDMYYTRYGQLELSCANCHEQNNGNMIRADHLSQGHTAGFPTYRLKNAGLVSIHNRFKGCIRDTRAETFNEGSDEFRALELYVAARGMGLAVEGVAVRP